VCALGVRAGAAQVRAVARKVRAPGPRRCVASRAAPAPTPAGRWPPVLVPAAPKTKCSQRMPQPPPAEAARRPWCHTATGRAAAGAAASAAPQTTRPRPPPPAALPQMLLRGRFASGSRGRFAAGSRGRFAAGSRGRFAADSRGRFAARADASQRGRFAAGSRGRFAAPARADASQPACADASPPARADASPPACTDARTAQRPCRCHCVRCRRRLPRR